MTHQRPDISKRPRAIAKSPRQSAQKRPPRDPLAKRLYGTLSSKTTSKKAATVVREKDIKAAIRRLDK